MAREEGCKQKEGGDEGVEGKGRVLQKGGGGGGGGCKGWGGYYIFSFSEF